MYSFALVFFMARKYFSCIYCPSLCGTELGLSFYNLCGYFFVLAWYNRLCVLLYCVLWRGFVQREVEMYYNPLVRISHMARSARASFSPTAARRGVSAICRDGVILERAFPQATRWR